MANTLIDLNRTTYLEAGGVDGAPVLDYLSAKYKNLKFLLRARDTYLVTSSDACNLPGIAHKVYGDKNYWWVIGLYNGIIFPELDLTPGTTLQLPALADINALFSAQDANALTNVVI